MMSKLKSKFKAFQHARRERRLMALDTDQVFNHIYTKNKWGDGDSRSGKGSNLLITTELRKRLPEVFNSYKISSMLDIPCGDFFWMKEVDLTGIKYIGADIVDDLAKQNSQFASDSVSFQTLDLTKDPLPKVDLIFVRDCLVHLSEELVMAAFENIKSSGIKYILTTDFPDTPTNRNIVTGQWREINLALPPYNLPNPIDEILEREDRYGGRYPDKRMGLWKVSDLAF